MSWAAQINGALHLVSDERAGLNVTPDDTIEAIVTSLPDEPPRP